MWVVVTLQSGYYAELLLLQVLVSASLSLKVQAKFSNCVSAIAGFNDKFKFSHNSIFIKTYVIVKYIGIVQHLSIALVLVVFGKWYSM